MSVTWHRYSLKIPLLRPPPLGCEGKGCEEGGGVECHEGGRGGKYVPQVNVEDKEEEEEDERERRIFGVEEEDYSVRPPLPSYGSHLQRSN